MRVVTFGPGAYLPFNSIDREGREVIMNWPPGGSLAPVSPEAESVARFPSKKLESDPPTVMTDKGDLALHVFLRWPRPLDSMMPLLSSSDDMFAQAQMSRIARLSASDLQGALRAAAVEAQPYLFQGHSTNEHCWFRPTLELKGFKHALLKAEDRGLTVPKGSRRQWDESVLKEALEQNSWRKWLEELRPGEPLVSFGGSCSSASKRSGRLQRVSAAGGSSLEKLASDSAVRPMMPSASTVDEPLTSAARDMVHEHFSSPHPTIPSGGDLCRSLVPVPSYAPENSLLRGKNSLL